MGHKVKTKLTVVACLLLAIPVAGFIGKCSRPDPRDQHDEQSEMIRVLEGGSNLTPQLMLGARQQTAVTMKVHPAAD